MKTAYTMLKKLRTDFNGSGSGFGWDDENKILTAPDDVWDVYLKACVQLLLTISLLTVIFMHILR